MSAALTFNTLKYANKLKAAGIDPKHAEAEAEALSEVFEANLRELVTKGDLKNEMSELRREISDIKFELLKWIIGIGVAQTGLIVGILMKLH